MKGFMSLGYSEITEKLNSIGRIDLMASAAVQHDDFLRQFLEQLEPKPEVVIEIGTFNGIGTVTLASMSKLVYTFDIAYRNAEFIWDLFEVREKISNCVAPQWQIDFTIEELIYYWGSKLNFNLAFIDGMHDEESVRHDFELVKFCKRVLFHDIQGSGVGKFVKEELGLKAIDTRGIFGYWEGK